MLAAASILVWLLSVGVLAVGLILFFMQQYRPVAWRVIASSVGVWMLSVAMLLMAPKPPASTSIHNRGATLPAAAQTVGTPVERAGPPREAPLWSKSGHGDDVFDMPTHVRRVRVAGLYEGQGGNFIVDIAGDNIINVTLGTMFERTKYEGTHLTRGGTVAITRASGVAWMFEEVR